MRNILQITFICLVSIGLAANEPILRLDTQGHAALIHGVIATKSGEIISSSNDKTIRVWDSKTGKEKRKILGEIGPGGLGKIYATALSPDEEILAVGGYFSNDGAHHIRVYDYPTGKIVKLLDSHTDVVNDLSFSSDGRYLASASADNTANIWSANSLSLKDNISFHTDKVNGVRFINKDGQYFLVSVSDDGQIALYDLRRRRVVSSHKRAYGLDYLAVNEKLKHIAACSTASTEILIYDYSLNLIKTIQSETTPSGLAYSKNGHYLIAGTSDTPYIVNLYSTKESGYQKKRSFKKHKNSTVAVGFLDNNTAMSGGGDANEIYIWDMDSGEILQEMVGAGAVVWKVGIEGDKILFGTKSKYENVNNRGELEKSISLKSFQISSSSPKCSHISRKNGRYTLTHARGGDYNFFGATLEIRKDDKIMRLITRDSTNGFLHNSYGFYGNYVISSGASGFITVYDLDGKEIANLVGHIGEVWSLAISGDILISGGDDYTVRVWNLKELEKIGKNATLYPLLSIFIDRDNEWVIWDKDGYYASSPKGAQYIGYHINQGADKEALFVSMKEYPKFHRPDVIKLTIKVIDLKAHTKYVAKRRTKQTKSIKQKRKTYRPLPYLTTPPMRYSR